MAVKPLRDPLQGRWACGCSVRVFGVLREFHAPVCNSKVGFPRNVIRRVNLAYEWSRRRDPDREQTKHYNQNRRRWAKIHDPGSQNYGNWSIWTDRTQNVSTVKYADSPVRREGASSSTRQSTLEEVGRGKPAAPPTRRVGMARNRTKA